MGAGRFGLPSRREEIGGSPQVLTDAAPEARWRASRLDHCPPHDCVLVTAAPA
jgi:hypothetical protein